MVAKTTRIGVLLAESQPLIRDALRALLAGMERIDVVGDVGVATDILTMVGLRRPDVVVLAIDGSDVSGFGFLQELPRIAECARVVVLTSEAQVALHARAVELGAMGVVTKNQVGQVLAKAIEKVHAGEIWLDRTQTATVVNRLTRRRYDEDPELARIDTLTPRERQIVALVAEGLRNKDLAERLGISEATARNHLTSILDKLQLTDRFHLAVYAYRRGLVSCPQTPAMLRMSAAIGGHFKADGNMSALRRSATGT